MGGSVEGPAGSKDTWKVRLESGMVFEFQTQNLQDKAAPVPSVAAAPAPSVAPPVAPAMAAAPAKVGQATDDELEFTPGQQVQILAPPAMAGKLGSVEGPNSEGYLEGAPSEWHCLRVQNAELAV